MKLRLPRIPAKWFWTVAAAVTVGIGLFTFNRWWPRTQTWVHQTIASYRPSLEDIGSAVDAGASDDHAGHDHAAHGGHDESTSLELSSQALRNCGLTANEIRPIQLETFRKAVTVPAVIVERPGRTRVQVATPMTGVITRVHAVQGESVEPGALLFEIRLTHEDLVQGQTDFLRTLGELDVEKREIARLQEVTRSGAVAGKLLLNREYARDKLNSALRAQGEALRLHGLSEQQIDRIARDRRLLRELQILAPSSDRDEGEQLRLSRQPIQPVVYQQDATYSDAVAPKSASPLILQDLAVHKGQSVKAGETLCFLANYDELFIEGLAFAQDIGQLRKCSENRWKVEAIFDAPGSTTDAIQGLEIAYFANQIDTESRTLPFYVRLPNEIIEDRQMDGSRFVEWKYLPGQRLQLRVPVEEWVDQIVLPVVAVAREGAEYFVFQQNGDHFDRVPVHVIYKDRFSAVVQKDGSLFPGDVVAMRGAHQMQMALKNKSGGGVDPHAGHNH